LQYFTAEKFIGQTTDISLSRKMLKENYDVHWHDFFEIELVLKGSGKQNLNGTEYTISEGCIYLLTPTDYHDVSPSEEIEVFNIMFHETLLSDEFLNIISSNKGNIIFKLEKNEFEEAKSLCNIMEKEYSKNKNYKNTYIKNLLECFMIHIFRASNLKDNKTSKKSTQIQKAIQHIHLHFKDNPSLSDIAKLTNTNPSYFSQKFKSETGKGYNEYLTERKIKYAKSLLKAGGFSVTEICFASGFNSLSNFMRVFKEKVGKSPTEYAKESIKKTDA